MRGAKAMKVSAPCQVLVFSEAVLAMSFTNNFKMLRLTQYEEKGNLVALMFLCLDGLQVLELIRCRVFPLTLLGLA